MARLLSEALRLIGGEQHTTLVLTTISFTLLILLALYHTLYVPLIASPLAKIPGPKLFALTKWRLALSDWSGTRTPLIHALHQKYGTAVRVGPNEVSFSSLSALRTIYGAGSGFERTSFYRMFDVYGRQNLFTFASAKDHAARKKVLAHAYSKSAILSPANIAKPLVERNTAEFLRLLETDMGSAEETFRSLHWFSLDSITGFLYGDRGPAGGEGGTHALRGDEASRQLLTDILDHRRRRLSWFAVHLPRLTKFLYTRTGLLEILLTKLGMFPMAKPATYTGIRAHALKAWTNYEEDTTFLEKGTKEDSAEPIIAKLHRHSLSSKGQQMDGLDIASEVADHLLAGIDTTSDTTMFLLWQLSLPHNSHYQARLIAEVSAIPPSDLLSNGKVVAAEVADRLPFLDALLKETLRLHAPLPASEPRSAPVDMVVDGFRIPAGTTVGMAPYTLHRNGEVFPQPENFRPERWIEGEKGEDLGDLVEMRKWFWAFSSGGRMCIGLHLAMAEMTTLVASIYRRYGTELMGKQQGRSPGITSRFEVFYDESCEGVTEHECWIKFNKR